MLLLILLLLLLLLLVWSITVDGVVAVIVQAIDHITIREKGDGGDRVGVGDREGGWGWGNVSNIIIAGS